ncbi:hypothetical protein ES705_24897 [subsurface metagenome]
MKKNNLTINDVFPDPEIAREVAKYCEGEGGIEKRSLSVIKQPNKFIETRQEYSYLEKRIIYSIINSLHTHTGMNVNRDLFENIEVIILLKNLNESNYQRIKQAIVKMQSRGIFLIDNETKQEFDVVIPFPHISYRGREGMVKVLILADMIPYLLELSKGYTRYQLQSALNLNSVISQRMYELLSRFKDTGIWQNVKIIYLKKLLNIEEKYKRFSSFEKYALQASQEELKNKTDISFTYSLRKIGRRYTHIDFYINYDKENDLFKELDSQLQSDQDEKTKRCLKYLQEFGINDKRLQKIILDEKQSEFWSWLFHYRENKDNIHNPAGYLKQTLGI